MAEIKTKKITDLSEKTEVSDTDLFPVGNAGTASLRKTKWSSIWNKILSKIRADVIVNNKTTTAGGYALDARMGKDLQDQVNQLNTKTTKDITNLSKGWLNWSWSAASDVPISITKIGNIAVIGFDRLTYGGQDPFICDISSIVGPIYAYDNDVTGIYIDSGKIYCEKSLSHAILTIVI